MSSPVLVSDSARTAGRILDAFHAGNLERLESELEQATGPGPPAGLPPEAAERWELLDAIARQMRAAVARTRRRPFDPFEGAEVQCELLRHLARGPRPQPDSRDACAI